MPRLPPLRRWEELGPRGEGGVYGLSPVSRSSSSSSNGSNSTSGSVGDDLDGGMAAARAMGGPGRDWGRVRACGPLRGTQSAGRVSGCLRDPGSRPASAAFSPGSDLGHGSPGFVPPAPSFFPARFGLADVTGPTSSPPSSSPLLADPGLRPRPLLGFHVDPPRGSTPGPPSFLPPPLPRILHSLPSGILHPPPPRILHLQLPSTPCSPLPGFYN